MTLTLEQKTITENNKIREFSFTPRKIKTPAPS